MGVFYAKYTIQEWEVWEDVGSKMYDHDSICVPCAHQMVMCIKPSWVPDMFP